jgi:hypothetical protein
MADFRKPPTANASHYVVDASGTLTQLKIPLGTSVTVHLWGGDGRGNPLRVNERGTNLVSVREENWGQTVDSWTFSYTVLGNVIGHGKLVALAIDDSGWAELPFEVTSFEGSHNWNAAQPAPQAMWYVVRQNFLHVRWLGLLMPPGHEDHSEGRAIDLGLLVTVPYEANLAEEIIRLLIAHVAEIGWSYFIWNRQIWISDAPIHAAPYTGKSAHTEHIHISWSRENSQRRFFPHFIAALSELRQRIEGN